MANILSIIIIIMIIIIMIIIIIIMIIIIIIMIIIIIIIIIMIIIIISIIIILLLLLLFEGRKSRGEIYTKHHSHSTPAGAELLFWLNPDVVLIKSRPSLTVFLHSSLRLSYFFRVAMVVGCSIAVTP